MFRILILFSVISLQTANANELSNDNGNFNTLKQKCSNKKAVLKSERIEKKRKFVFGKLPHKRIVIFDRIIDANGNEIIKTKSVYICSLDACDTKQFRRIKIIENEIWIFEYNRNPEKAIIKRYNFCGKYLSQKKWDDDKSFEDY